MAKPPIKKAVYLLIITFFFVLNSSALENQEILFSSPGSQTFELQIPYSSINGLNFNITGSLYSSSYPSNITLDFNNDSIPDWSYLPYNSLTPLNDSVIEFAWTLDNPSSAQIDFISEDIDGTYLARLTNNLFIKSGLTNFANIVIGTADSFEAQIIQIITNTSTTHAFLPAVSPLGGHYAGFYLTQGGSTYYCNSDHSFSSADCNLTYQEAITPEHLARQANETNFSYSEPVESPIITRAINEKLSTCEIPCNITINVTSKTPGNITISAIQIIGPEPPANISITENSTHYQVTISPEASLTGVEYAYGKIPTVNIIPLVASDDNTILTQNQSTRYNILIQNLSQAWDNLTNYSHPLNFTFYQNPKPIPSYQTSENSSSQFFFKATSYAESIISNSSQTPQINIIVDIHDYFPNQDPSNSIYGMEDDNIIGEIYLNGFSDSNSITSTYDNYEEILLNIILHELAHTFIRYPQNDNTIFYSDHPASYTNSSYFETYNTSNSPTSKEGYMEIYSILNQARPYVIRENIAGNSPTLSPLDKMLLGTKSYHEEDNYTFYETNLTWNSSQFELSTITSIPNASTYDLYTVANRDILFWDIRENSSKTNVGIQTSFSISKATQNKSALWVYAYDAGHTDYFKVFNNNAISTSQTLENEAFLVELTSPEDETETQINQTNFICQAYTSISNITLYTNITGWNSNITNNSGRTINQTITQIPTGSYIWNCYACNTTGTCKFAESNYTLTITDSEETSCGDSICNGEETCSTCSADCGSCTTSSSGGGGGGGSSSSIPEKNETIQENETTTYEEETKTKEIKVIRKNETFQITIGNKIYSITLTDITNSTATVFLESKNKTETLRLNQSIKLDLNENQVYETIIKLEKINLNESSIEIILSKIEEESPLENPSKNNKYSIIIFSALLMLILITTVKIYKKSRKTKPT